MQITHLVIGDLMNLDIQIISLEIENSHVIKPKSGLTIPNIHTDPVDQVIAVRFYDQLTLVTGDFTKQTAKCGLGAGVQMDFRLLHEENVGWR